MVPARKPRLREPLSHSEALEPPVRKQAFEAHRRCWVAEGNLANPYTRIPAPQRPPPTKKFSLNSRVPSDPAILPLNLSLGT